MKQLHQAEPTHRVISVSELLSEVALAGFPTPFPLGVSQRNTSRDAPPTSNDTQRSSMGRDKKVVALLSPAQLHSALQPQRSHNLMEEENPASSTQPKVSSEGQQRGRPGCFASWCGGGSNPAAAKLREEAVMLIYICKWSRELSAKLFKCPITIKLLGIHCKNSHNTVTNLVLMWTSAFHCSYFVLHHQIIYQ